MAENSAIQWTDHTFNPWSGCAKVHEGCKHCYAEVNYSVKMRGVKWGPGGNRIVASDAMWKEPLKWNRLAEKEGRRRRVFCASLADVFEDWKGPIMDHNSKQMCICAFCGISTQSTVKKILKKPGVDYPIECPCGAIGLRPMKMWDLRKRLFELIDKTPMLDWQLLTKRPENIREMWATNIFDTGEDCPEGEERDFFAEGKILERRDNVWLGTSVSMQEHADKQIPALLNCRDIAQNLFISVEPLLAELTLREIHHDNIVEIDSLTGDHGVIRPLQGRSEKKIDWVIVGGESGHKARPCKIAWIRSIVKQCQSAKVPVFVKQLGAKPVGDDIPPDVVDPVTGTRTITVRQVLEIHDSKGGDPSEWPEDLRVREFPVVRESREQRAEVSR